MPPRPMTLTLIQAALCSLCFVGHASSHDAELIPRRGERRLNANVFMASHNSYQRSESTVEILDNSLAWGVEWDLCWDAPEHTFHVNHEENAYFYGCNATTHNCTGPPLLNYLSELRLCNSCPDRVTAIWLEFGRGNCSVCPCPEDGSMGTELLRLIETSIGWDAVYTRSEFLTIDNGRWPSWQELVRRGKHWIVFHQRFYSADIAEVRPFLFGGTTTEPADCQPQSSTYMAFAYPHDDHTVLPEHVKCDWWLTRVWPDIWCTDFFESFEEGWDEWDVAVAEAPTLVATNCISPPDGNESEDRNLDPRIHPHQPCFVQRGFNDPDRWYGSLGFPYGWGGIGLAVAIGRVSSYGSSGDLWIEPGTYNLNTPVTIDHPMRLMKWDGQPGSVVID